MFQGDYFTTAFAISCLKDKEYVKSVEKKKKRRKTLTLYSYKHFWKTSLERPRIQNPSEHLKWSFLQKLSTG